MTDTIVAQEPTEAAPKPRSTRFPCFDGYRAIAALLVLLTHVTFSAHFNNMRFGEFFARMDAGVAIFFLLSGFLLYRPFVMARLTWEAGPGVVALYALSEAWQLVVLASPGRYDGMYMTWLPAWLDLFSLGMGLAVVSAWMATHDRRDAALLSWRGAPAACWALAAVAFWAVSTQVGLPRASIVYTRGEEMSRHVLYGATAFFLLLPGIF